MGQPSIVYECVDGVREVLRERHGGLSPGDVIARESTQSNPDTGLPEFDLPGRGDLGDHCGEEFPAFACQECGHPVYIGNTCYSPVCSRCWAGSVKRSVISAASKIENHRYDLYYDQPGDQDVRTNHVVASPPPNIKFDSENPLERALLSIQEILPQFLSEPDNRSFYSIYHPWRIKPEYRKDIYDHGGEEGEGDMRWSDVLSSDDWEKFVKFEPHFHLFFNSRYFDKSISEKVEADSGWVFHRIEDGQNISVENLEDLTKQLTYCLSHVGVKAAESRDNASKVTRYKGTLHNTDQHPKATQRATAAFAEAAPTLLGVSFSNTSDQSCSAEVASESEDGEKDTDQIVDEDSKADHPLKEVWKKQNNTSTSTGGNPSFPDLPSGSTAGNGDLDPAQTGFADFASTDASSRSSSGSSWSSSRSSRRNTSGVDVNQEETSDDPRSEKDDRPRDHRDDQLVDDRSECGGDLIPIAEAVDLLDDANWCQQAEHVSGLRVAKREWEDWKSRFEEGSDSESVPPPTNETLHIQ